MGINLKQVIKALELHANAEKSCVDECPYGNMRRCGSAMAKDAISLIKELTEENERLRKHNAVLIEDNHILSSECIPMAKADTVRKMQTALWANLSPYSNYTTAEVGSLIDQIAKEMVEG